MNRVTLVALFAGALAACNSAPSSQGNIAVFGNSYVVSFVTPYAPEISRLPVRWYSMAVPGQLAIADILSYGRVGQNIDAPAGWALIRDDSIESAPPIRQTLYWHVVSADDSDTQIWKFKEPVDAQGAIVLLDNMDINSPLDASTGNVGGGNLPTAKSVVTTRRSDLIMLAYATNYSGPGLGPLLPSTPEAVHVLIPGMSRLLDRSDEINEYWIDATYQATEGSTPNSICVIVQNSAWVAAQIALRTRGSEAGVIPKR